MLFLDEFLYHIRKGWKRILRYGDTLLASNVEHLKCILFQRYFT